MYTYPRAHVPTYSPHIHTPVHVHTPCIFVSNNNPCTIVSKQFFGTLRCQFPSHALGRRIVCGNIAREAVHGEGQTTFTFITPAPLLLPEVLVHAFPRYQMPRSCFNLITFCPSPCFISSPVSQVKRIDGTCSFQRRGKWSSKRWKDLPQAPRQ